MSTQVRITVYERVTPHGPRASNSRQLNARVVRATRYEARVTRVAPLEGNLPPPLDVTDSGDDTLLPPGAAVYMQVQPAGVRCSRLLGFGFAF